MKAGAVRDVNAMPSMVTPIASSIAEAILPVMQYVGIKKIYAKNEEISNLKKTFAEVEFFDGTPHEMRNFVSLIKDSLAELIAASGLISIDIEASEDEVVQLIDSYEQLKAMYKAAKVSSEGSDQPVIPSNGVKEAQKNTSVKHLKNEAVKTGKNKKCASKKSSCKSASCKAKK